MSSVVSRPTLMARIVNIYIILILMSVFTNADQPDVCLWGIADNTIINGRYTYWGMYNNQPYYRKYAGSGCITLYIYWTDNALRIHETVGSTLCYAYCVKSSDPNNCDGSWTVYDGYQFVTEPNAYTQSGSCPSWNCDKITTSMTGRCGVIFDEPVGINQWRSSINGNYWYFNPYYFNWVCHDELISTACPTQSFSAKTNNVWKELSKGQSIQLNFNYPSNTTQTINCIGSSTNNSLSTIYPTNISTSTNAEDDNDGLNSLHILLIIMTVLAIVIICTLLIIYFSCFYKKRQAKSGSVECEGASTTDTVNKRNIKKLNLESVDSSSKCVADSDIIDVSIKNKLNRSIPVNMHQRKFENTASIPLPHPPSNISHPQLEHHMQNISIPVNIPQPNAKSIALSNSPSYISHPALVSDIHPNKLSVISQHSSVSAMYTNATYINNDDDYKRNTSNASSHLQPGLAEISKLKCLKQMVVIDDDDASSLPGYTHSHLNIDALPPLPQPIPKDATQSRTIGDM